MQRLRRRVRLRLKQGLSEVAEEEDEPSDAAAGSDGGDRVGGDEAAGT